MVTVKIAHRGKYEYKMNQSTIDPIDSGKWRILVHNTSDNSEKINVFKNNYINDFVLLDIAAWWSTEYATNGVDNCLR